MNKRDVLNFLENMFFSNKKRDIPISGIWYKLENALDQYEDLDYSYVMDFVVGENGTYAIFQANGALYKAEYHVDNSDNVIVDSYSKVSLKYEEFDETENRVNVFRSASGELLWMGIASSAVLNRVGQIDTTELFDDFERNFDEDNRPYLTLQHLPKEFSFGDVRGVFRHNSLLFAYGSVDESTLLGRFAEERFSSGGWGISIGFVTSEEPELLDFDGVLIPAFQSGTLVEVSALLEERAAAYFTSINNVERGLERKMAVNKEKAKELLVEFIGDNNESEVDELLELANKRERQIEDEGLITREVEDGDTEEDSDVEDEEENEEDEEVEILLDERAMSQIVENVSKKVVELITPRLDESMKEFDEFRTSVERQLGEVGEVIDTANKLLRELEERGDKMEERVVAIEREEDVKIRDAVNDLPASRKKQVKVGFRATEEQEKNENEGETSLREISKATRDNLKIKER
jgi:hypothetical protein